MPTVVLVPDTDRHANPGPAYRVLLNEIDVGVVFKEMATFERGPRYATYVTRRWQSPRWFGNRHHLDRTTRRAAITDVLVDHFERFGERKDYTECEKLAETATVRRG